MVQPDEYGRKRLYTLAIEIVSGIASDLKPQAFGIAGPLFSSIVSRRHPRGISPGGRTFLIAYRRPRSGEGRNLQRGFHRTGPGWAPGRGGTRPITAVDRIPLRCAALGPQRSSLSNSGTAAASPPPVPSPAPAAAHRLPVHLAGSQCHPRPLAMDRANHRHSLIADFPDRLRKSRNRHRPGPDRHRGHPARSGWNWRTFELQSISFDHYVIDVPNGLSSYHMRAEWRNAGREAPRRLTMRLAGLESDTGVASPIDPNIGRASPERCE